MRSRLQVLGALCIGILLIVFLVILPSTGVPPSLLFHTFDETSVIPIWRIVELWNARLQSLASSFDETGLKSQFGLKVTRDQVESYGTDLSDMYTDYFIPIGVKPSIESDELYRSIIVQSSPVPYLTTPSISASTSGKHIYVHPNTLNNTLPHNVYTTARDPIFPPQFESWAIENPDWQVIFYDDPSISAWIQEKFQAQLNKKGTSKRSAKFGAGVKTDVAWDSIGLVREFRELPDSVVKADFFRYLVLLLDGGVYTDTDTACVKPIRDWPGLFSDDDQVLSILDPFLSVLPSLLALGSSEESTISAGGAAIEDDFSRGRPSLVVALEHDGIASHSDWRSNGLSRGMQFVQWTMAAKPHHPVFMDVLGRILREIERAREQQQGDGTSRHTDKDKTKANQETIQNVLDWTGPGAFSDAVFRYLLARWGVHPHQVSGHQEPIRVGDVLILPEHSFRADFGESPKSGGPDQGRNSLVWHGFFGSWKGSDGDETNENPQK